MVDEATVDCYNDSEQATGLFTTIDEHLALPFQTLILGVPCRGDQSGHNRSRRDHRDMHSRRRETANSDSRSTATVSVSHCRPVRSGSRPTATGCAEERSGVGGLHGSARPARLAAGPARISASA